MNRRRATHDDQLTVVEHLDELRMRIVVSAAVLVVATAFCFWQDTMLLEVANPPLPGDHLAVAVSLDEAPEGISAGLARR